MCRVHPCSMVIKIRAGDVNEERGHAGKPQDRSFLFEVLVLSVTNAERLHGVSYGMTARHY